jgi:hypothetical protein
VSPGLILELLRSSLVFPVFFCVVSHISLKGRGSGSFTDSPLISIGFSELKGSVIARLNKGLASLGVASIPLSRKNCRAAFKSAGEASPLRILRTNSSANRL